MKAMLTCRAMIMRTMCNGVHSMGEFRQKNVHRIRGRDGVVRKYHRWTRTALPHDVSEDHPEFVEAWLAEEKASGRHVKSRAKRGTLAEWVEQFILTSPAWKGYQPSTKRWMRDHLGAIAETGGEARGSTVQARHIQQNMQPLTPSVANTRRKAWAALMTWAVATDRRDDNPMASVRRIKEEKTGGHPAWTHAEIHTVRETWPIGSPQRLAFELIYWTGARVSDVVHLGPSCVADGFIRYTQTKTKNVASAPFSDSLPTFAHSMRRDLDHLRACLNQLPEAQGTWIMTQHGRPRSVKGLSNFVAAISPDGKSAHGLRKSRLQHMAEAGATTVQMQAWCGHESITELEGYIRNAARLLALKGTTAEQNL